jgi:hypothetical protein
MKRRRRRRSEQNTGPEQGREALKMEDVLTDFSIDELREFLEADLLDVDVDPEFKERLRRRLWDIVQEQARRSQRDPH